MVVTSGLIEKLRDDPAVVETLSPSTAPLWFGPIPHGAHWPIEESVWVHVETGGDRPC